MTCYHLVQERQRSLLSEPQRRRRTPLLLEKGAALLHCREEPVCYKVCCAMAPKSIEMARASQTYLQHKT